MKDPTIESYKKVKAFRDLIADTLKALEQAQTPVGLVSAIDSKLKDWEAEDNDFATVLRDLKGQAYSMSMPHIRAVTNKLCEHLRINLARIEKGLQS